MVEEKTVPLTPDDVEFLKGNAKQMLIAAIIFSVFIELIGLVIYLLMGLFIPLIIACVLSSFLIAVVFIFKQKGGAAVLAGTKIVLKGTIDKMQMNLAKEELKWDRVGKDKVNITLYGKYGVRYEMIDVTLGSREKERFSFFIWLGEHKIPLDREQFFSLEKNKPIHVELTKSGVFLGIK